jgi:NADH-quinone oxidoreductase subunit E
MYLLTQWWLYLLLAALIGFVAGWWWSRSRVVSGDAAGERDAALAEKAALEAELAGLRAAQPAGASTDPLEIDRLRWRARYLEARNAFLEAGAAPAAAAAPPSNASFTPSALAGLDPAALEEAVLAAGEGAKPQGLSAPQGGGADNLKAIGGVGPKNEAWLHAQGLFHFWQIATLDVAGLAWLSRNLPTFGSRVYRENWVDQATRLARGEGAEPGAT